MRVLLIEDNSQNTEIFLRMFANQGIKDVVSKSSGFEGLEAAQQGEFDAIYIDFDLPDISGLHIGLSLHNRIESKRLKPAFLIALTAQSDRHTQLAAEKSGFDAFIGKPCTETDLVGVLTRLQETMQA